MEERVVFTNIAKNAKSIGYYMEAVIWYSKESIALFSTTLTLLTREQTGMQNA